MRLLKLTAVVVSLLAPSLAFAQPALGAGSCALATNQAQPFVGETFTASLAIRNTGTSSGFAPAAEVFVPPGLTLTSATAAGTALAVACQPSAATFTNPLTREVVTGPTGMAYCFIRYPLSSLPPAAGVQAATLTFSVAGGAAVGTALTPQASCLFAFGSDALLNNSGDPVVRSDVRTNGNDQITSTTVTPAIVRVAKAAPAPTASGPNFSASWSITVDVANGITLAGNTGTTPRIRITDTVPSTFQLTSITAPGATAISAVPAVPGGSVDVEYTTIVGAAGIDRTITLTGFVPRTDASSGVILSQSCAGASTATMSNSASATNMRIQAGAVLANVTSATVSLQARAEAIRETIANVTAPGTSFRPGQTGRVTLDVDVSDYFNLTGVSVASTLGAGAAFDVGSATVGGAPVTPAVSGSEPTTLTFTLGTLNGNATGGTRRQVSYTFTVLEVYAATAARVQGGDVIDTTHVLTSTVSPAACGLTSNETNGGSNASVTILPLEQFAKSIFAISRGGVPQPITVPAAIQPGDLVTWRLRAVLPSGDQAGETIVDYLPLPLFLANEYGASPTFGSGAFVYGPDNTLPVTTTVSVTTSPPTANNSVTFTLSGFETLPSAPVTIDLLMRFTVQNSAQEDGLVFTNLGTAAVQGSGSTTTSASVVALVQAEEPLLFTTLGITQTNGVNNPGAFNGVYTSTSLAATPETANASGVDGADTVEFTMIIENRGKQPAREVSFRQVSVNQFTGCTNPTVTSGGAAPATIATSGNLFIATGLSLGAVVIPATDPTSGANVVVIKYTCTLQNTGANAVSANQTLTNLAELIRYTNVAAGPNFVSAGLGQPTDAANITTKNFSLAKTLTVPATPFSRTVQDQASYSIAFTVPEGITTQATLVDTLPAQLALTSSTAPTLVLPAGVTCSSASCSGQNVAGVVNGTGQTITWTFGTLTNTNTDNTISETTNAAAYSVVVLDVATSNHGRTGVVNALSARINNVSQATAAAQALNIVEPRVTLAQVLSPSTADAADTVSMTATITNAATRPTAYDLAYTMTLPAGITPPLQAEITATGSTAITVVGQLITVTYASIAASTSLVITYPMTLNGSIPVGTTVGLLGTVTASTQPGVTAQIGPNTNAIERQYTITNTANLTIKPFVVTNVRTSAANAVIGDYVTHTISVVVPEGSRTNFEITQNLPIGLAFVDANNLVISGPVLCDGIACAIPTPTVSNNGRTAVFNFGTVTNTNTDNNTNETLTFEVREAVTNVAGVVAGSVLGSGAPVATNTLSATAGSGAVVTADTTPVANKRVTIIEPTVVTSAAFNPTTVNAGDSTQITFSFAAAGGTSAHDFTSSVTLANMTVTGFGTNTCPFTLSSTITVISTTAAGSLPSGSSCSFIVNAQVNTNVTVGASLSAATTTRWTSLAGVVSTSRSTYYNLAVERTGNVADVGGAANTYTQTLTPSIAAASAGAVVKTFVSTSDAATTDPKLAMGEDIVYRLTISLQEGVNPSVLVTDSPPRGMRLLSVEYEPGTFTGSLGNNPTNLALNGTSGQAFAFNLGTVTLPGDNVPGNDTFALRITARALLATELVNTTTSQVIASANGAGLSINGATETGGSAIADFVLPLATVSTLTSPATIGANGVESVSARLANTGTGPICNTTLTLAVPAGFTPVNPGTDGLDNDGIGGIDDAAEAGLLVAGQFVVPITGCVAPAATVTYPFQATAAANIAPGTAVFTTTLGSYNTLPASAGQTLTPTADFIDNNANGQRDETGDAVGSSSSVTVQAPVIVFSKTYVNLDGGVPKPTDLVEYTIAVQNTGTASTTGVTVTDTLPTTNASVVSGSESISPSGGGRTISLAGSTLSANIGTLAAASTVTLKVRLQLNALIDNGVTVSNQATLATTDGYGPRASNDPTTGAANDPTDFTVASRPRLALNSQPTITSANVAAYTVSGTCTNGSGDGVVTVTIGTFTTTTPCTAGTFSKVVDLTSVADSAALNIVASQTNPIGTTTDTKTVLKDTVTVVAISAPGAGVTVSPNPTVSGNGEVGATVTLKEGSTTLCTTTVAAGGTWSCPTSLGIGAHTVTAVAVDLLGNTSPTVSRSFVVDLLPVVVISSPVTINAGNVAVYPVSGTCTIGSGVVTITIGSVSKSTPCDASGAFSTTLDVTAVPDGATVSILASQTNTVGTGTDTKSAKKDTSVAAPVIVTPANGSTVAPSPAITGTAEANATVTVKEGSTTVCTATADNTGAWSCASSLGVGTHTLVATQVDASGNGSVASAPNTFTIWPTPVVTVDTPGPVNASNASAYLVTGTCVTGFDSASTLGLSVVVSIGSLTKTGTCAASGTYSFTFDLSTMSDLAPLVITAVESNSVGTSTDTKSTVKDTVVAVAFTNPANGTTVAPSPTLTGTTEAGATVTVTENGNAVCTATANSSGVWSCTTSLGLGSHTLQAIAVDVAGNTSAPAFDTFTVVGVPVVVLDVPVVINASNRASYPVSGTCTPEAMTVTVSINGVTTTTLCTAGGTFSTTLDVSSVPDVTPISVIASQSTPAGSGSDTKPTSKDTTIAPPVISGPANASTVAPNPTISGSAEPNATVTVREGGTVVCTATANSTGQWSCPSSLGTGSHTITATQTDVAGNTSAASTPDTFTVAAVPQVRLATPGVVNAANASMVLISGTCTLGAGNVTITVGSVTATASCVGPNGFFTTVLDLSQQPEGSLLVTASQTNLIGTGSDTKPTLVDTEVAPVVITGPTNGSTVAAHPPISGTAEPFAIVTVREGTTVICTARADSAGRFSCNTALELGTHTVTATQVDPAGNQSAASTPVTFTIAGVPVVTVSPLPVINAGNAAAYPVSGTCTAGAGEVTVTVGGITTTTPCEMGMFSVLVNVTSVPDGASVSVTATQSNPIGTGTASATTSKDAARPQPPVIVGPTGGATYPKTPDVTGTSEPGATVDVYIDGVLIGTTTAGTDGTWSLTPGELSAGSHTASATAKDSAGNVSTTSSVEFIVTEGGFAPGIGARGGGCNTTGGDSAMFALLLMALMLVRGRTRCVVKTRN